MTHHPLWVILCCLPEKWRKGINELVEKQAEGKTNDSAEKEYRSNTIFDLSTPQLCKSWLDTAIGSIWSGSTLFAINPAVLDTSIGSKMDLLKGYDEYDMVSWCL